MDWTPEEKELFQELREMPKVQLSNRARENMSELMKRQAAVDRKKRALKLATGGMTGVAAAIALTIGILNYDEIKSKFESKTADPNQNPTVTTPVKHGATYRFETVYNNLGNKREPLKQLLEHSINVTFGWQYGINETAGQGDFRFRPPYSADELIKKDHEKFRELFREELTAIDQAIKENGGKRYRDGDGSTDAFSKYGPENGYMTVLFDIDNAYKELYNALWKELHKPDGPIQIHNIDGNTPVHSAVNKLLAYHYLIFGNRIQIPEVEVHSKEKSTSSQTSSSKK
jgi:hypothetical protein